MYIYILLFFAADGRRLENVVVTTHFNLSIVSPFFLLWEEFIVRTASFGATLDSWRWHVYLLSYEGDTLHHQVWGPPPGGFQHLHFGPSVCKESRGWVQWVPQIPEALSQKVDEYEMRPHPTSSSTSNPLIKFFYAIKDIGIPGFSKL